MRSLFGIGAAAVGLLALLWGAEDAQAAEGGDVIGPDDILGQQEAAQLGQMLDDAISHCKDVAITAAEIAANPNTNTGGYEELGGCDKAATLAAIAKIEQYPWQHPQVKKQALAEAKKLRTYVEGASAYAKQSETEAKKLQQMAQFCSPGVNGMDASSCVEFMYTEAKNIRAYPWSTAVEDEAYAKAAALEAAAKDIEDQQHAQNMASMGWELAE